MKRIGRYLLGTKDKGLILKPSGELKIDCYVDSDFAGLWGYEKPDDTSSVKSRTGFMIQVKKCPISWTSKLQTEISLSTMEAEYVALITAMRDLIPMMDIIMEVFNSVGLKKVDEPSIVSTVWE